MQAPTFAALIAAITEPQTTVTPGGAVQVERVRHWQHVGNVVWAVVAPTFIGVSIGSPRIVCWELEGDDTSGWTAEPLRERFDLRHLSCPLEYLDLCKPPVSAVWREAVWAWHEAELTRAVEGKVAG